MSIAVKPTWTCMKDKLPHGGGGDGAQSKSKEAQSVRDIVLGAKQTEQSYAFLSNSEKVYH